VLGEYLTPPPPKSVIILFREPFSDIRLNTIEIGGPKIKLAPGPFHI